MGQKFSLLKAFLRHPRMFIQLLRTLKSTRLYMNALVAEYFIPILKEHTSKENAIYIHDFVVDKKIKNIALLEELLVILEKNKYIERSDDRIWQIKPIPENIVKITEEKLDRLTLESFRTFTKYTKTAIEDRLLGKPIDEFDSGELRIQWDIALRGDFYRYQRQHAFAFIKFDKLLKKKKKRINILDYGCGAGDSTIQILNYIQKGNKEFYLDACDVSEGLIEIAEEDEAVGLPIKFFSLNNQKPNQNYYDFIFISQVFHWLEDPIDEIDKLKSYLKPGGILFGVQSHITKTLYHIDLFIRLLGAKGFPKLDTLYSWFKANDLIFTYDPVFYSFKGEKKL